MCTLKIKCIESWRIEFFFHSFRYETKKKQFTLYNFCSFISITRYLKPLKLLLLLFEWNGIILFYSSLYYSIPQMCASKLITFDTYYSIIKFHTERLFFFFSLHQRFADLYSTLLYAYIYKQTTDSYMCCKNFFVFLSVSTLNWYNAHYYIYSINNQSNDDNNEIICKRFQRTIQQHTMKRRKIIDVKLRKRRTRQLKCTILRRCVNKKRRKTFYT